MYEVSMNYKNYIKDSLERDYKVRLTVGNVVIDPNDIYSYSIETCQPSDKFTIGNSIAQMLKIEIANQERPFYNNQIFLEIGMKVNGAYEYIPIGYFNVDKSEKEDRKTVITAYDNMYKLELPYMTSLGDKKTVKDILSEITNKTGIGVSSFSYNNYTIPENINGYTCREVVALLAGLNAGNAYIDRTGKIKFVYLSDNNAKWSITDYHLFDGNNFNEKAYKIDKVTCYKNKETTFTKGSLGVMGMEIQYENLCLTDDIATDIYNKLKDIKYQAFSMETMSYLALDPGDWIEYKDQNNAVYNLPVQHIKFTGGIKETLEAKTDNNNSSFNLSGSLTNQMNRVVTELLVAKKVLSEQINTKELCADKVKFATASGMLMDVQTLLSQFISGENGQVMKLTSKNVKIDEAIIKDIVTSKITVGDLVGGNISTNKFNILSNDGGISIVGNTMQFKDKEGKVRLQIGKDEQKNFTFVLIGEDGTTALYNEKGITKNAVPEGLIVNKMISKDASIDGGKIDMESLFTSMNGSNETLKTSKILYDDKGQTLDIAFKNITTTVDKTVKSTEIEYYLSTSTTSLDGGIWSTVAPQWAQGKYMWSRVKSILSDGKVVYSDATCISGAKGDTGEQGERGLEGLQGPKGEQGLPGLNGADGKTSYFHIKYSSNSNGNPMSEDVNTYIGTYVDYIQTDSTDYKKYTWKRFQGLQGDKGEQGIPGTNGANGKTSYLHIKYANKPNPTLASDMSEEGGDYIGQYTDFTLNDSNDPSKYTWTKIKGEQGVPGVKGDKGTDGKQFYTWVKYADTPTSGMSDYPESKDYIGLAYNKSTPIESNDYKDYTWSLVKGDKGDIGLTGQKGADGKQYFTWLKYADTPTSGMSDSPNGKKYVGFAYNKTSKTESLSYADYNWSLIKGDKGDTGNGIQSVSSEFYISTSKTAQVGGSWVKTCPEWVKDHYLWTRSKITYTNGVVKDTEPAVDSSWEAVNCIEIGGRNILADTNSIIESRNGSHNLSAVGFSTVKNYDLQSLIGKNLVFSYYVSNMGKGINGPQNPEQRIGERFGMHGCFTWKDSTGKNKTSVHYPFCDFLTVRNLNKRVVMKLTNLQPPAGYDTLEGISIACQPYAYSADTTNKTIWKIGQPKLEIGTKASDYSEAIEDTQASTKKVTDILESNIKTNKEGIKELFQRTTITEDGKEKLLKDAFTTLKRSYNGFSTEVAENETHILDSDSENLLAYSGGSCMNEAGWSKCSFTTSDVFNVEDGVRYKIYNSCKDTAKPRQIWVENSAPITTHGNINYTINFKYRTNDSNGKLDGVKNVGVYLLEEMSDKDPSKTGFYAKATFNKVTPSLTEKTHTWSFRVSPTCTKFKIRFDLQCTIPSAFRFWDIQLNKGIYSKDFREPISNLASIVKTHSTSIAQTAENIKLKANSTDVKKYVEDSNSQNYVKNGCFLNGFDQWIKWGNKSVNTVCVSTGGYKKSLEIVCGGGEQYQGVFQIIDNLQPSQTYTVSAYVYAQANTKCMLTLQSLKADGTTTDHEVQAYTTVGGWQWIQQTITMTSTRARLYLGRNPNCTDGKFYFTACTLKKGTVRGAWSENPDYQMLMMEQKINALELGGRNYLKNSNFKGGNAVGWSLGDKSKTTFEYYSEQPIINYVAHIKVSGITTNSWIGLTQGIECDKSIGKAYTFSCYIKVPNGGLAGGNIGVEIKGRVAGASSDTVLKSMSITKDNIKDNIKVYGSWCRVSITYKIDKAISSIYPFIYIYKSGEFFVGLPKFEDGTKVTAWSPAPEDMDITAVKQYLAVLSKDRAELDKEKDSIYNNTKLSATSKASLQNVKTSYNTVYDNLVSTINSSISDGKIVGSEATNIENKKTDHNTALGSLRAKLESCRNEIMGNTASSAAKNYVMNGCFIDKDTKWTGWLGGKRDYPKDGVYHGRLKVTPTATYQGGSQVVNGLEIGATYTLSAYVYCEKGQIYLGANIKDIKTNAATEKSIHSQYTGKWEWLETSIVATNTTGTVFFGHHDSSKLGPYSITAVTLKKATVRSDWSENPDYMSGKISEAELKIAPDKISATVTEGLVNGKGCIKTSSIELTKDSFNVNSEKFRVKTKELVKNKAGKYEEKEIILLQADTNNKQLKLNGIIEQRDVTTKKLSTALKNNGLEIYDWRNTLGDGVDDIVGGLTATKQIKSDGSYERGGTFLYSDIGNLLHIGYKTTSNNFEPVITVDNTTQEFGGGATWAIRENVMVTNYHELRFVGGDYHVILGSLGTFCSSDGDGWSNRVYLAGKRDYGSPMLGYMGYDNLNFTRGIDVGSNVTGGLTTIHGTLTCTGGKERTVRTEHYGWVKQNAYETADCYFGDILQANTDDKGYCYIAFEDKFLETVNTKCNYHVFCSAYGDDDDEVKWVKCIKREEMYFVIKGSPNTEFSVEVKCKQLGYENRRLAVGVVESNINSNYEIFDKQEKDKKAEDDALIEKDSSLRKENELTLEKEFDNLEQFL